MTHLKLFFVGVMFLGYSMVSWGLQLPALETNWKMISVGCENPAYQYSADEQAMIDAVEHVGRYPWTDDVIRFTSATEGTWSTTFIEDRNAACTIHHNFKWSIDSEQNIHFLFGASTTESHVSDPNTEISCSAGSSSGEGQEEAYRLTLTGENQMTLSFPGSFTPGNPKQCGSYGFYFAKEK